MGLKDSMCTICMQVNTEQMENAS